MSDSLFPRRRDDVLTQAAGDTVLLLSRGSGAYFTLNEVGGRIWDLADGSRTVPEIAGVLALEFDAPTDLIEADAREILGALRDEALLHDAPAAA